MKRAIIILNLVFLLFLTSCNKNSKTETEPITDIIETDIIVDSDDESNSESDSESNIDIDNKIFINVVESDKMFVPLTKDGHDIKWEYDKEYLSLEGNQFKVKKDGNIMISATYLGKVHLYSITIKNDSITNTVQYNLNFYYSFITDKNKIGNKITPSKIVFHNTANTAPAVNEIKWLNSIYNTSSTSFHYAVDDSGVYQAIPTTNASYHAGNLSINNCSIGIEIAKSNSTDLMEKDEGIKNATILIALLMNYYNININNVITHQDASGKYCPHDIFDRYGLELFYDEIKKLI